MEMLKFKPQFKSVLWGGRRIAQFKGIPSQGDTVGESWELSPVPGHESVVAEGPHTGMTLPQLLAQDGDAIMGKKLHQRYGDAFPLLIKLIDSQDDLSIQVHPDDELAAKRHNSLGKTEMWYSIAPTPDAYLYSGLTKEVTPEELRQRIKDNTIIEVLGKYTPRRGDMFFLPAGRIHSIGAGNFVVEIQQASDVTYRIYDYDRRDAQGNPRELHVEQSLDAIDYAVDHDGVRHFEPKAGEEVVMEDCKYFTTTLVEVGGAVKRLPVKELESFRILVATRGNGRLLDSEGHETIFPQGQTVLVPASTEWVDIIAADPDRGMEVVTTYIK